MNKRLYYILILVCISLSQFTGYSQDVHFTQFYLSPLTTNPALTGHTEGDWRLTANHRNQWNVVGKPYSTTSLGFEHNFYYYNEKFSGGIMYLHDQSGVVELKYDKIMLSGAYHKKLGKNIFHFGIQPGYVMKSVDMNSASLPEQYDRNTGSFNSDLASSENLTSQQVNYFDFNAGINYTLKLKKLKTELGYAMFHINRPNESFFGQENNLPTRHILTIGAEYKLTPKLVLYPHFLHMNHYKASEMLFGFNLMTLLQENKAKATGAYAGIIVRNGINRNTDAIVAVLGLKFKNLEIGFNYDFNVSGLRSATQSRGAYEFSIVYTGASSVLNKTAIPCDRF